MAVAAPQGANCISGAILGFSILLKDTSACPTPGELGIWTSDLRSLDHQLYPWVEVFIRSFSFPLLENEQSQSVCVLMDTKQVQLS